LTEPIQWRLTQHASSVTAHLERLGENEQNNHQRLGLPGLLVIKVIQAPIVLLSGTLLSHVFDLEVK
jgi:hypothetical protein